MDEDQGRLRRGRVSALIDIEFCLVSAPGAIYDIGADVVLGLALRGPSICGNLAERESGRERDQTNKLRHVESISKRVKGEYREHEARMNDIVARDRPG